MIRDSVVAIENFRMVLKSGRDYRQSSANPVVEVSPPGSPPLPCDGLVSGALLGQAASQALAAAFSQDGFTLDGTDNEHSTVTSDYE